MNELKCLYAEKGCKEVFRTNEELFSTATFICRHHTTKSNKRVNFQDHQFDRGIARGTEYIANPFEETTQDKDKVRHKKLKSE